MTPSEVVEECRKALGSTQELARWVNKSDRTVRRWLAGERVPDRILSAMVALLEDTGEGRPVSVDLSVKDKVIEALLSALRKARDPAELVALSEEIRAWTGPRDVGPWT